MNNAGLIIGVQGQIVDIAFNNDQPNIHDILVLEKDPNIKMQVSYPSSPSSFFCLSLSPTDTLCRGLKVINTKTRY